MPDEMVSSNIIIKFDVEKSELDAKLMGESLLAFHSTISVLAQQDAAVSSGVVVRTVTSGCIEIHAAAYWVVQNISAITNVSQHIIENLKQLVNLYKFLKAQSPKSVKHDDVGNTVKIENHIGDHAVFNACTFNSYTNLATPPFGEGSELTRNKVRSVTVLDEGNKTPDGSPSECVTIAATELQYLVSCAKTATKDTDVVKSEETQIVVATVPLHSPKNKWSFIHDGSTISAKIYDEAFLAKIERGAVSFSRGVQLDVVLQTRKRYDPSLSCMKTVEWAITRVNKCIARDEIPQSSLFE